MQRLEEGEGTREEGYKTAIQLSRDAESRARNLATFSNEHILAPGEKVYRSVCDSL